MGVIESAIKWMENTARDDRHGYCQTHRWGEDGDYDCSGAVITAWQSSGVPVKTKGASYTGNIYSVFKKCGFSDVTSSVNLKNGLGLVRGDVLLKPGSHVAMYCGNGKIVDACINEKGTITGGKPGDQTGKEFWVHNYYNYPWQYVLRYRENSSATSQASNPEDEVVFTYAVRTEDNGILSEVTNLSDYAGIKGKKILDIAIKCNKGSLWYQVHCIGDANDKWLPKVTGYDWSDHDNGYAGDNRPIDCVRVCWSGGNGKAQYHVSPVNHAYYDWQYNDDVNNGQDGYAGEYGVPIDRFQLF